MRIEAGAAIRAPIERIVLYLGEQRGEVRAEPHCATGTNGGSPESDGAQRLAGLRNARITLRAAADQGSPNLDPAPLRFSA